jgi:hypothetical protein
MIHSEITATEDADRLAIREPTQVLDGREALMPVFDDLNRYQATMHFNGQSARTPRRAPVPKRRRLSSIPRGQVGLMTTTGIARAVCF